MKRKKKKELCPDLQIDICVILTSNHALFLARKEIFSTSTRVLNLIILLEPRRTY